MEFLSVRLRSIFCFGLLFLMMAPSLSNASNIAAEVVKIKGDVYVKRKSERLSLKLYQKLYEDDVVETSNGGRIKIRLDEGGNEIVLGGDTELKIERVGLKEKNTKGTVLGLNKGSVRSNVRKKYSGKGEDVYQVRTPNAVAGVRGTVFMVSFSPRSQESLIATERGAVAWKSRGQEMLVAKGMFASVVGQRMSALQSIKSSPEIIKKINEVRRDAGENALPIDVDGAEVSPDSAKAEPRVDGVKREEVSRVEYDEKGNTVVVVDEEVDTKKFKRGPASVVVDAGQGVAGNSKSSENSRRDKPVLKVPPIRTVLIRKDDVGGVIKTPLGAGGQVPMVVKPTAGDSNTDNTAGTGTAIKEPLAGDGTYKIVEPTYTVDYNRYTDVVRDTATAPPPIEQPKPATFKVPIGPGPSDATKSLRKGSGGGYVDP